MKTNNQIKSEQSSSFILKNRMKEIEKLLDEWDVPEQLRKEIMIIFQKEIKGVQEEVNRKIDSNYGIHKMCAIQAKKEIDKIFKNKFG